MSDRSVVTDVRGLSRRFGERVAVDDVTFSSCSESYATPPSTPSFRSNRSRACVTWPSTAPTSTR
jgi:hypothetical protein